MRKKERYRAFTDYFQACNPVPTTELYYRNAFELLIAVILSAQCSDKRINQVTPALFRAFPSPYKLAEATAEEVYAYIKSVAYPHSKTRYLIDTATAIVEKFGGKVPDRLEDLVQLRGVGRKTAHVVLAVSFNKPVIAVDRHVARVSKRLGLVKEHHTKPRAIEDELMRHMPKKVLPHAHHWLVLHGRYVCLARKPRCKECPLTHFCRFYATTYAGAS